MHVSGQKLLRSRALLAAAVAFGVAYLGWRLTTLGSGGRLGLSIPLFALELWGMVQLVAFAYEGWHRAAPTVDAKPSERLDVVVTAHGASPSEVDNTLIAVEGLTDIASVTVVDDAPFERRLLAGGEAPFVLWLRAGQMPMPDLAPRVMAHFDDPRTAVVQIGVGALNQDSLAHLDRGRDEHSLFHEVIGPSRSARGLGPWSGPGSVLRRSAVSVAERTPLAQVGGVSSALVNLQADGHRTRYEARPLVRETAPDELDAYLAARREQAIETLWPLRLGFRSTSGTRLNAGLVWSHLAAMSRFGGGLRLVGLVAVVMGTLLTGTLPFDAGLTTFAALAAGQALLALAARRSVARSTMASGDWLRQGWRTIGADLSAFAAVAGLGPTVTSPSGGQAAGGLRSVRHLVPLVVATVGLELAILLRSATLLMPELLPAFGRGARIAAVTFGLLLLVPMVDVLQLVVTRRQRRRVSRVETDLAIRAGAIDGRLVDLAPSGMGVVAPAGVEPPEVGDALDLRLTVPVFGQPGGRRVEVQGTVRAVSQLDAGAHRMGLELTGVEEAVRAVLVTYCAIDHPRIAASSQHRPAPSPADLEMASPARRSLRLLTASAAAFGALTVAAGPSAFAESLPEQVCVVDPDGAGVKGVLVSLGGEKERQIGTTDASGCVRFAFEEGAELKLAADGVVVSRTVEPGALTVQQVASPLVVSGADGRPVKGARLRLYDGKWIDLGSTDEAGAVATPVLPGAAVIEVTWEGRSVVVNADLSGGEPFGLTSSRLLEDEPGIVAEVDLGAGWVKYAPPLDVPPGRYSFRLADGSVLKVELAPGQALSVPSGKVTEVETVVVATPTPTSEKTVEPVPTVESTPVVEPTTTPDRLPTVTPSGEETPTPTGEKTPTPTGKETPTPDGKAVAEPATPGALVESPTATREEGS